MIRNWYNQIQYPALKTKRERTKYINWQQFTKGTRGIPNGQLLMYSLILTQLTCIIMMLFQVIDTNGCHHELVRLRIIKRWNASGLVLYFTIHWWIYGGRDWGEQCQTLVVLWRWINMDICCARVHFYRTKFRLNHAFVCNNKTRFLCCLQTFSVIGTFSNLYLVTNRKNMSHVMRKTCLCHMRTTKAPISLRIRAVWSAPLLFAARLV